MLSAVSIQQKAEPLVNTDRGTVNQCYRVGLILVKAYFYKTQIRVSEPVDEIDDLPTFKLDPAFVNLTSTAVLVPEPISTFVNLIGIYKDTTDPYFP